MFEDSFHGVPDVPGALNVINHDFANAENAPCLEDTSKKPRQGLSGEALVALLVRCRFEIALLSILNTVTSTRVPVVSIQGQTHRPPHSTFLSLESSLELAKAQAFCHVILSIASSFRIRQQRRPGRPRAGEDRATITPDRATSRRHRARPEAG
jgi:hypothetical protein